MFINYFVEFLQRLINNFGWHFVLLLVSAYLCLKGAIGQLASSAQLPYFKALGVTGELYQSYGTVASTPWAMKAAIGLLSDTVPIFGYHKRYYILFVSLFGAAACCALGLATVTPPIAALLLLLANLQLAVVDLLCEGKYAEMMVAKPESGSDLVTFVWGLVMLGSFVGSSIAGPVSDYLKPRYVFLICLPLAAQVVFPTIWGWLPEEKLPAERRGIRMDKIREHPRLVKLSVAMTIGAVAIGFSALVPGGDTQSAVSVVTAIVLCVLGWLWLPKMLAKANLYMFLSSTLYVSISGATDYFFTAGPKCVPGGPHFSYTYYVTYASLVGSVAGALGVSAFQVFLSRGNFRIAFGFTCLVKLAASFFDIVIVMRLNKKIGIPDKLAFMLGDAIIYQVASMLDLMPAVVLTSKVCPKGMEASVYALLASYQNLGSNISRAIGVFLTDHLGIKTKVPCDFRNLPWAIFIAHVALPLLVVPLVFVLIPNASMKEDLLGEDDLGNFVEKKKSITSGSKGNARYQLVDDDDPENQVRHLDDDVKVGEDTVARRTESAAIDVASFSEDEANIEFSYPESDASLLSFQDPDVMRADTLRRDELPSSNVSQGG